MRHRLPSDGVEQRHLVDIRHLPPHGHECGYLYILTRVSSPDEILWPLLHALPEEAHAVHGSAEMHGRPHIAAHHIPHEILPAVWLALEMVAWWQSEQARRGVAEDIVGMHDSCVRMALHILELHGELPVVGPLVVTSEVGDVFPAA